MSNERKQTSIDWLVEQMFKQGYFDGNKPLIFTNLDHLQQQAKEMYRKELELAYEDGKEIRHILNTIEKNKKQLR